MTEKETFVKMLENLGKKYEVAGSWVLFTEEYSGRSMSRDEVLCIVFEFDDMNDDKLHAIWVND